jgi:tetratricopeptide (TPR) repeat protein
LTTYDKVDELAPDEWMAHLVRGIIYSEMGDLEMAQRSWERAEEIDADVPILWITRGLSRERQGETEAAAADYARAQRLVIGSDPVSQFIGLITLNEGALVPAYFFLLECATLQIQGRAEDALAKCEKALETDPAYFDALWKSGQLHAAQDDWDRALTDYSAAIEAGPGWPWAYFLRAQALTKLGRSDEAQADLARALELNPVDELRQQIAELKGED